MNHTLAFLLVLTLAGLAQAQGPAVKNTEAAGKMVDTQCAECHGRVLKGDVTAIYTRADRRVRDTDALAKQVHACSAHLKSPLFPEEEEHLATYLNQRYYHFK